MTATVIRTEFEHNLEHLQEDLLVMGSMVNTAIEASMQALKNREVNLAHQVVADDEKINNLRHKIENDCISLIARQQPVATDLRIIIGVMTIVQELERMGDHAAGIAKIAVEMGDQPLLKPLVDLPRMAEICQKMISFALDSFIKGKKKRAKKAIKADDKVDDLYEQVMRELLTFMVEDPRTITRAMYLLFVGHNLERIGDRAVNIAERTFFRTTGQVMEVPSSDTAINLDDMLDDDDDEDDDDDFEI